VGLLVLFGFFELVSRTGAIRKGMEALEGQTAEQTRYLAAILTNLAISTNSAGHVLESSHSSVDVQKI
jgi:uncharacterized ion transporter superfamily protein YfcC